MHPIKSQRFQHGFMGLEVRLQRESQHTLLDLPQPKELPTKEAIASARESSA